MYNEILEKVYKMMEEPDNTLHPWLGEKSREYGWKLINHDLEEEYKPRKKKEEPVEETDSNQSEFTPRTKARL